jgi:ATP-binding cassette subfamily B protein
VPQQFNVRNGFDDSVQPSDIQYGAGAVHHRPLTIEYRHVTFAYRDSGEPVLRDLNLNIPSGATVAIVGRTGSGKSTVTRLLARLYEPKSGAIYIDGKRWDEMPVLELRRLVGYVDQTTFLFSTTIRNNIAFGMGEVPDEAIRAAAYTAGFDRDVEDFSDGYETRIGERGITLSGGQQQRLALARALVMDTPVLVLDDALSAVDTGTEAEILERLAGRLEGCTTLFVTHRLAAAERADVIAVIGDGRVAEFGSHKELLSRDGIYAAMFRRQRLAEELGAMA